MAKRRISFVLALSTAQFSTALTMAQKKLMRVSRTMKNIGTSITRNVTMPFAAISVAGAKMAIDFDKNMTKIQTLVGVTADEVDVLRKEVLSLSGQTAQAPADLADGLFFLTSAGLQGANAMETLEAVSKGVAIGLGEQADLAKVAAAAQNAYGEDTLKASEALDIFGGMVKTGMFEASDLAQVLGTQLGLAANLGISFEELGAMISTYTKTTGDARAATTGLSGIMMSFAKIGPKQEEALEKVGLSADSLRQMLSEQGLNATLVELQKRFNDNGVQMSDFFTKSQSLKGVLGVLGNQTETYKNILDDLETSTGFVADGFDVVSQRAGFKMQQALQNLKNVGLEIGDKMMPILLKVAKVVSRAVSAFSKLDSGTQSLALGITTLLAASGPIMSFGSVLVGIFSSIIGVIAGMSAPILAVVGVIVGAAYYAITNWEGFKTILVDIINYFINLYNESILFRGIVETITATFKILVATGIYFGKTMVGIVQGIGEQFTNVFRGIGTLIEGVFTGNYDKIKQGAADILGGFHDVFKDNETLLQAEKEYGEKVGKAIKTGVENTLQREPVAFITEDDVQGAVDKAGELAQQAMDKIKGMFKGGTTFSSSFSGGGGSGGEGGGGGEGGNGGGGGGDDPIKTFAEKYVETMASIEEFTSQVFGRVSGIISQHFQNKNTELDNYYRKEQNLIANSQMSEQEKADAQLKLDEEIAKKRRQLQIKQAKADKKMKLFQAIINVASEAAKTIANPFLFAAVLTAGLAQIATIKAQPIPALAEGGLAYGPTTALVGDNIGAASDPEVIAPLSKLNGMMQSQKPVAVYGVISGEDIVLSSKRTNQRLNRIS